LGDFKDRVNPGDEYAYDGNGDLTLYNNKGITSIVYNHLNLPSEIGLPARGKVLVYMVRMERRCRR